MSVTVPDEIWSPDSTDLYRLVLDLAAMADSMQDALTSRGSPVGVVNPFAGTVAPSGWLLCSGQAVSRLTYAALFAVIGTAYGTGDGSTTFNVPDARGRVLAGVDALQTEFNALGKTGGSKTHTLLVTEIPSHAHDQHVTAGSGGPAIRTDYTGDGSGQVYPQGITTGFTGGGLPHNNIQPYISLNYIIKV